jgi:hypothetical protein
MMAAGAGDLLIVIVQDIETKVSKTFKALESSMQQEHSIAF